MRRLFRPVKRTVYFAWVSRHMGYHVLIGLVYAWVLREIWQEFNPYYVALSVFGSIIMDLDHVLYFFIYGRNESYAKQAKDFLRRGRIITLASFLTNNHKTNTNLRSHNIYVALGLLSVSALSFLFDFETAVVLFGSMTLHLIFDIIDDLLVLGELNSNWKHWGGKR